MTQGISQLYCSNCNIEISSFNKGISEVVTSSNSMSERLKALGNSYQLCR